MPQITYERTIPLWHSGLCRLLGISAAPHAIYAEEVYGDGNWVAQYGFQRDGALIGVADEARGENPQIAPLALPDSLKAPSTGWVSMALNLGGIAPRGNIRQEKVMQTARPLKTPEKEMLIARGLLPDVPLNHILGVVGSYVSAEAQLVRGLYWLIRQLRVAIITDGSPDEYETYAFNLLHSYTPSEPNRPLHHTLVDEGSLGILLSQPADLGMRDDLLVIAEAGADGRVSALHLWAIEPDPPLIDEETDDGSMGR